MRGHAWTIVTLACVVSVMSTAPSSANDPRGGTSPTAYVIGDSVLLGASNALVDLGIDVDTVEGRRPTRLMSAWRMIPDDGRPVVVHLGTNGPFTRDVCTAFQELVGDSRTVVFVTVRAPRSWVADTNDEIRRCARDIPSAIVLPWHRIANETPGAVYADGIHLTPTGTEVLVREIVRTLAPV